MHAVARDPIFSNRILRHYRVRWRFDFHSKPAKYGMWSNPGDIEKEGAWKVNKDGLSRASIEQECLHTFNVTTVAECDGHDFVNFEWADIETFGMAPSGAIAKTGKALVGLTLVTRETAVTCLVNGDQFVNSRSEFDKKFHYAGFGR